MDELHFSDIVTDPFVQTGVLAVVGAVVTQILLRRYPARRLIFQVIFFSGLTALLHHHGIIPYEIAPDTTPIFERIFVALAKIIWWINAAWLLTACARAFLIFERRPREGRLIQDVVVGVIYLSAFLSVVAYVFRAPVGTLIATSGVFAVILGLALQSTLADVFSGIALNLSKAYEVGDWVILQDGIEGRVVETNWRATHLLNSSNDLVVLPNSGLAKAQLTNLSSPSRSHGVKLRIRLAPTTVPSAISDVLRTALLSSNSITSTPSPSVDIKSLDAQAIEYELSFRVTDFSTSAKAKHEIYDLIYRHVRASGLVLAPPPGAATTTFALPAAPVALSSLPEVGRSMSLRLLDAVPLFASLDETEKQTLAASMAKSTYRKGDVLVEQGRKLDSLMIVRSGVVIVLRVDEDGDEFEQSRLAPGDYFGEDGLFTGAGEASTVRALTLTEVYEVGQQALAKLMKDRPSIADEISVTLSRRTRGSAADAASPTDPSSVSWLVTRIRQLFEVPHG